MWFFLKNTGSILRGGYFRFKTKYLEPFTFPEVSQQQEKELVFLVDTITNKKVELNNVNSKIVELLAVDFKLIDPLSFSITTSWYDTDFKLFIQELSKKKVKMTTEQEEKWLDRFNRMSVQAREIKQVIDKTDKEIDKMVYSLYGLTEEEIKVIEG